MLVFVLAALLCCLYASDTIIISYCYRYYPHNPSSAKLLLLSEALKLTIATCLFVSEKRSVEGPADDCQRSLLSETDFAPTPPSACSSRTPVHQGLLHLHSSRERIWQCVRQSARTLLVFSVPSVCYFGTNNLSFYALTLMSAHLYTLLCDLKIISTGLLNYLVLDKRLNQQAVASLVVLFLGICVGQYSTMRETAGSLQAMAAASHHKAAGFVLMAVISLISAVASVYTEWVMNHSEYKSESLNHQNMRLYAIGLALNAAYYWQGGGRLQGFLSDMQGPHWAVVLILALMGLITGVLIKHYGNIVKVYASSIASLFAAWVSQVLLKDPPPALFYAGVFMAMAATVQLQRARTSLSGSADGGVLSKSPRRPGQQQQQQRVKASLVVPVALAVMVLVFVPQMIPWSRDWAHMQVSQGSTGGAEGNITAAPGAVSAQHPPVNLNNPASLVPRSSTDALMPALPPFEPTCLVRFENRTLLGCRPLNCSLAETCTVRDKACCAHFNFRMLDDVDRLLFAKGLQGEYALVYGSALGAARNQSVLGHTHDIDMAFSPTAIQVIAQNATREQLWRKGYVLWHDRYLWRLCPHDQHPAADFRAAMVHNMTHEHWEQHAGRSSAVYMDGYLMWPKPEAAECAEKSADPNVTAKTAVMMQPLAPAASEAARAGAAPYEQGDTVMQQPADLSAAGSAAALKVFCLQQSKIPITIRPGDRPAAISDLAFPAPDNMAEHLTNTYGPNWSVPDLTYHGVTQKAPDWWAIQQLLLSRLAVTAWGDMTWPERRQRCSQLQEQAAARSTPQVAPLTPQEQQLQGQQQLLQGEEGKQAMQQRLQAARANMQAQQQQLGRAGLQGWTGVSPQLEGLAQQQQEDEEQQQGLDDEQALQLLLKTAGAGVKQQQPLQGEVDALKQRVAGQLEAQQQQNHRHLLLH